MRGGKVEEHYFAVLETGLPDTYTTLSRQVRASEGDIFTLALMFFLLPRIPRIGTTQFNDDGFDEPRFGNRDSDNPL